MTSVLDADMLQRACDITDRIMSGVGPEQAPHPTPCGDWTVQQLMEHMVASTDFFADAAEFGEVAGDRDWPDYALSELLPAQRRHAQRMMRAYRVPGVMDRPMTILAGPSTASFCIQVAISERFVHAWDLAVATGQVFEDDDEDIAQALLASPEYVAINNQVRANDPPPFAREVPINPDAKAVDRLMAFLGRDPAAAGMTNGRRP